MSEGQSFDHASSPVKEGVHWRSDWRFFLGVCSCFLLAFVCLGIGIHTRAVLVRLLNHGKRSPGVVVKIDVGARSSKRAIIEFVDDTGQKVTCRDQFQMYFVRQQVGENVTVLYDPTDSQMATIDLGSWLWQGPVIFSGGFVILFGLGILFLWTEARKHAT